MIRSMTLRLALLACLALPAGCADKVLPVNGAGATTALPTGPAATTAQISQPPDATVAPPGPSDACGAADLAYLVGKARTEIPVAIEPSRRRVVQLGGPLTPDHVPTRQTITYDPATNLVTAVSCG